MEPPLATSRVASRAAVPNKAFVRARGARGRRRSRSDPFHPSNPVLSVLQFVGTSRAAVLRGASTFHQYPTRPGATRPPGTEHRKRIRGGLDISKPPPLISLAPSAYGTTASFFPAFFTYTSNQAIQRAHWSRSDSRVAGPWSSYGYMNSDAIFPWPCSACIIRIELIGSVPTF